MTTSDTSTAEELDFEEVCTGCNMMSPDVRMREDGYVHCNKCDRQVKEAKEKCQSIRLTPTKAKLIQGWLQPLREHMVMNNRANGMAWEEIQDVSSTVSAYLAYL